MATDTTPRTSTGQASRAFLREEILRAVDQLLGERPWSEITMSHIAAAADVSRQTLYNEFGSRDDFVGAYVLWAADQFLDEVERAVADHRHDLRAALRAAFELFLTLVGDHALIRGLEATSGTEGLLALAAPNTGSVVVEATTDRLEGIIRTTWPELTDAPIRRIAEVLVRLALSHLLMPTSTPAEAAEQVTEVLTPLLDALTAALPS